jgi:hypothetical protein
MATYRSQRFLQSKAQNGNFYFGPRALLLYGAASFVYEALPSLGPDGTPDLATISTFFGAVKSGNTYVHTPERFPAKWYNRRAPYTLLDAATQAVNMYNANPEPFGGNAGVGNYVPVSWGGIVNGQFPPSGPLTTEGYLCLLYQLATGAAPVGLAAVLQLTLNTVSFVTGNLNPIFKNLGCPLVNS